MDIETYQVLYANRVAEQLFGSIRGKICWQVIEKDQTEPCPFCKNRHLVTRDGDPTKPIHYERQNTITDRWYDQTETLFQIDGDRLVKFVIAFDVTENKESQLNYLSRYSQNFIPENFCDDNAITIMCQNCNKVRDNDYNWHSLIPLVESHLNTSVSFGICPGCVQKYYSDFETG